MSLDAVSGELFSPVRLARFYSDGFERSIGPDSATSWDFNDVVTSLARGRRANQIAKAKKGKPMTDDQEVEGAVQSEATL